MSTLTEQERQQRIAGVRAELAVYRVRQPDHVQHALEELARLGDEDAQRELAGRARTPAQRAERRTPGKAA